MKRYTHIFSLLLLATAVLSSCLNSDDTEVVYYSDASIESFALGNLNRYYSPASNPDTTYKTTVTGTLYPMTIDHLGGRIFNRDSMPVGTVPYVLCTLTTKNSGLVGLNSLENDTLFSYFSSTDSVDFSQPRVFRVVSTDGTNYRDYTVTLNIAQTTGTSFGWQRTDSAEVLATLSGCRPVVVGGRLLVMGCKDGQTVALARDADGNWGPLSPNVDTVFDADAWKSVAVKDGQAYMLTGQTLLRTADGQAWEPVASPAAISRLLGAGTKELFALGSDGLLKASRDEGLTWTDELLDDDAALLPDGDAACVSFSYGPSPQTDYVLLAGTCQTAADTLSNVWRKISYYAESPGKSRWVYMPKDMENHWQLPRQQGLTMACYDGRVLAVGSDRTVYYSQDQGITWQHGSAWQLPDSAVGDRWAIAAAGAELWIVTSGGEVWNGRKH